MSVDSVSIPSIWASMNSWFTPAVLFVLLNLMIGTIAFTSTLANQKQQQQQEESAQDNPQQPKLARSPSVLQRLRSINFSSHRSQEFHPSESITTHFKQTPDSDTHFSSEQAHQLQTPETETQFVFQQTPKTENHGGGEEEDDGDSHSLDEVYSQLTDRRVSRTKTDTEPASGEIPAKLPTKIRKSASLKSAFGHFEEEDIVETRRPATVRERTARVTEADEEVDAKADDFINKFKQQLKLQRLDSIIRYKDMISRGSAK